MVIKREWEYKVAYRDTKKMITPELKDAAIRVLESGMHSNGWEGIGFEKDFINMFGVQHAVAVSSGTSALISAFMACEIGTGDEVILSPFVFWGAADAIVQMGATPVFVESDPNTFNIDPTLIKNAITPKTKAIEVVHHYGQPCDMDPIQEIAQDHNLRIIEDACHACGAKYKGKYTGALGDAASFSFGSKNITCCGGGGMATTAHADMKEKIQSIRYLGTQGNFAEGSRTYESESLGFNFLMPEIQAALGRINLQKLPKWHDQRNKNAQLYNELLADIPEVQPPVVLDGCESAFLHYVIKAKNRDALQKHLLNQNIHVKNIYSRPVYHGTVYKERFGFKEGAFPISEQLCQEILGIPVQQFLTEDQIQYVVDSIRTFYRTS